MELQTQDTCVVCIGPLDGRSTALVREAVYERLDHDLVVDLTQCEWIDAAALRMLVAATRAAHRDGHHLLLRVGPHLLRLLHMSRTRSLLEVEPLPASA